MKPYYIKANSSENTDSIFRQFTARAITHFKREADFSHINHFERLLHSHEKDQSIEAISNFIATESAKTCTILTGEYEPVEFKAQRAVFWMITSLMLGSFVVCFQLLFVRVNTGNVPLPEHKFWFKVKKYYTLLIKSFNDEKPTNGSKV